MIRYKAGHHSQHTPAATLLTRVSLLMGSLPTKLMNPGLKANRLQPRASVVLFP